MSSSGLVTDPLHRQKATPYEVTRVADLPDESPTTRWMIEDLWLAEAVGIVGASPKMCKTWLALDMAVSVASGTACLGRFAARRTGRVMVFAAEDDAATLKSRVRGICDSRKVPLDTVDIVVIGAPQINCSASHRVVIHLHSGASLRARWIG